MEYWLKNKTDKEKAEILESLIHTANIRTPLCSRCGAIVGYANKRTINVGIYDRHLGQRVKKLCTLCNNCYYDLLDYLEMPDVEF